MEQKLSKEEIMKLISLYRSNEVLWNMDSRLYRRNDLKIKAYEDIGSQMGMPADIVKKKYVPYELRTQGKRTKCSKSLGQARFPEMQFLDSSIAVRHTSDNSEKNSVNLHHPNEFIEDKTQDESFSHKTRNKRACGSREEENSQFDVALKKLMDMTDKENEFTAFATSLAFQLQKLPEEDAYELMGEMQNLLVQRKLKTIRERRFHPIPEATCSSTEFSDILSCAISNAEIEFD